jgi:Flp pilus assembly protein CpaB
MKSPKLILEEFLMRTITSTIAALTLAGAVGVLAQEPAPAPPSASKEQTAPKSTLTGCVVQAKTTDGGTAFVLTKVDGGSASMYVLGGSSQSEWPANVNKKVEVTGPVQEAPAADKDSPADPKVVRPPLIVVESMKVVAESCT